MGLREGEEKEKGSVLCTRSQGRTAVGRECCREKMEL